MLPPRRPSLAIAAALAVLCLSAPAWAHAFGIRYDLPLPLWLYLVGAGAAVALSFAIMALFLRDQGEGVERLQVDLLAVPGLGWLGGAVVLTTLRALSVAVFALLIAAGLFGDPDPFKNIAPVFVWVVWWVGMAFVSTLIGNLWDLLNPWKILFTWLGGARTESTRAYPAWLGYWPAVLFFLLFVWMELISEQGEQPRSLAILILVYSTITWAGMALWGRDTWLRHGEAFAAVYGLLARFAPLHGSGGKLILRLPSVGLLCREPVTASGICFVLLLLTSVTFDGILETPMWAAILTWISESQLLRPLLLFLRDGGIDLIAAIKSVALLLLPLCFVVVFLLTSRLIAWAGGGATGIGAVAGSFVLSLVPIAIAYHLAHYLSYLLIAGQNIIPMVSDPFGWGWDLFGTVGYAVDIGVVNAKMVWYLAVTAIVVGHVLAVYIGHVMATRVFPGRGPALRSQIPMLLLMVGYTMVSLWILSQPIISD